MDRIEENTKLYILIEHDAVLGVFESHDMAKEVMLWLLDTEDLNQIKYESTIIPTWSFEHGVRIEEHKLNANPYSDG